MLLGESPSKQQVYYICGRHQPDRQQDLGSVLYYLISQITPKLNK